ncbi:hypothetical protein ACJMK2_013661 [Sinanodonta woodiana]|uniref:Uncharacterized protein n=1 Tax=Sinanodonta woodiana TaxID=1069815 RepID=A0ABD3UY65_SINWO
MLKLYLDNQMEDPIKSMKTDVYPVCSQLTENTLAKVIIFNKRTGVEAAQLLIETYLKTDFWIDQTNEEILAGLSSVTKKPFYGRSFFLFLFYICQYRK